MDANDIASTTMSFMPKDLENLVTGINTYGFSECIMYYESVLWDLWMFYAEAHGTGMGYGIVLASLTSRLIFAPLAIYSQTIGLKMKLLQPDSDELMASMKRH